MSDLLSYALPARASHYSLERTLVQRRGESMEHFVRRVKRQPGVLGVSRANIAVVRRLIEWSQRTDKSWLWLTGCGGSGKTLLTTALGNHLIKLGIEVCYVTETLLWYAIREDGIDFGDGSLFRRMRTARLLIFDDMSFAREELPDEDQILYMSSFINYLCGPVVIASRRTWSDFVRDWELYPLAPGYLQWRVEAGVNGNQLTLEAYDWRNAV